MARTSACQIAFTGLVSSCQISAKTSGENATPYSMKKENYGYGSYECVVTV